MYIYFPVELVHNCCLPTSKRIDQAGEAKRSSKNSEYLDSTIVTIMCVSFCNLFSSHAINQQKKQRSEEGQQPSANADAEDKKERVITIRPLNMEDFREAKKQVEIIFSMNTILEKSSFFEIIEIVL